MISVLVMEQAIYKRFKLGKTPPPGSLAYSPYPLGSHPAHLTPSSFCYLRLGVTVASNL